MRETIFAENQAGAEKKARELNRDIRAKRNSAAMPGNDDLTVGQAFERTVNASGASLTTRCSYTSAVNLFLRWLGVNYPAVKSWSGVKTDMVRSYVMHCHRELKLTRPGVRFRLLVIKMASRFWAENEPERYRDVARAANLPKDETNPLERAERERRKALSAADARALLEFLRKRRPDLYGPAMLQTLCGLRVLEALALRECDVDLQAATITITKTATHKPKNRFSYRTIPVPSPVLAMLRDVIAGLPIGDRTRPVFLSAAGAPWVGFSGYCNALGRKPRINSKGNLSYKNKAFAVCWREQGIEALFDFQPHWLRATFASGVLAAGADSRVVQAYMGHARGGGDMLGLHYEQIPPERMRAVIIPAVEKWWHQVALTEETRLAVGSLTPVNLMAGGGGFEPPTF